MNRMTRCIGSTLAIEIIEAEKVYKEQQQLDDAASDDEDGEPRLDPTPDWFLDKTLFKEHCSLPSSCSNSFHKPCITLDPTEKGGFNSGLVQWHKETGRPVLKHANIDSRLCNICYPIARPGEDRLVLNGELMRSNLYMFTR